MELAMNLLEGFLPSYLVNWTPLNESGYSERHALLFRLNNSLQRTVHDALRDRRLKMTTSRFFTGNVTLWKENREFRLREHIELVDDVSQAFSEAFRGNLPWKMIILSKKNLVVLVCDSLLFPILAKAARISLTTHCLKVNSVCNPLISGAAEGWNLHFFHQDPSALRRIAIKCATSLEIVLVTLIIQSIQNLQENFGVLLHSGCDGYVLESLPQDPITCLRHISRLERSTMSNIDASMSRVACLTILEGNSDNNLLWHSSTSSSNIGLQINVVNSEDEGLILTVASDQLRRKTLEFFDKLFCSNLTYLMMALRISWSDNVPLDPKLGMHFETLCDSFSSLNGTSIGKNRRPSASKIEENGHKLED